ncbi:MAG: hypothetical protein OHK0039_22660 [Bacteroidia bacterium]
MRYYLLLALLSLMPHLVSAQCLPDTTVPPVPGIYPAVLPSAIGCQYYESVVTFVFPRDTTVNVAGTNFTFPFVSFTIDSIIGLPQGMSWECNLQPDCRYIVHPDSAQVDTIGCLRVFGTPTIPANYPLVVAFTARAVVFGQVGDNPATYEAPLAVQPCQFTGACYTLALGSNCEPASLTFTNEVSSNGQAGFSYLWTLSGPGVQYSTSDENPFAQQLAEAGTYTVSYQATIDTVGYILNGASITAVNCADIGSSGDLYWILKDPGGNELVNTTGSAVSNGGSTLPLSTGIGGIFLQSGTYEFQVWDEDAVLADQGCATGAMGSGASVFFTVPPANPGNLSVTSGGLTVVFIIDKPVQVITCTDTFAIDSLPTRPLVLALGDSLPSDTLYLCQGETLLLSTPSADSLQWYYEGSTQPGASQPVLPVTQAGRYVVEAIDRTSLCRISSTPVLVQVQSVQAPSIAYDGQGLLLVASPDPAIRYDWYRTGVGLIGSGTTFSINATGQYYAVAVDTATGCASPTSVRLDLIVTSLAGLPQGVTTFEVWPNPAQASGRVRVQFQQPQACTLSLYDLYGRRVWTATRAQATTWEETLDVGALAQGLYLLVLDTSAGRAQLRWLLGR